MQLISQQKQNVQQWLKKKMQLILQQKQNVQQWSEENAADIAEETERATVAEEKNAADIETEASTARAAETANATAIAVETTRATTAEEGLEQKIETAVEGIHISTQVYYATTKNLDNFNSDSYSGSFPLPESIDGSTTGDLHVDGVRVLVKDQAHEYQNGIYVVSIQESNGTRVLKRTEAMNEAHEIVKGNYYFVEKGTVNANKGFVQTSPDSDDDFILNKDSITYALFNVFSGTGAGRNILVEGNTVNFNPVGGIIIDNTNDSEHKVFLPVTASLDHSENKQSNNTLVIKKQLDNEEDRARAAEAANATAITANEAAIATNASGIAANTADIATNTAAITANTDAITFNKINVLSENPTAPQEQDKLYINSTDNTLYRYNVEEGSGGEWISVGGSGGSGGGSGGDSIINAAGQTFAQLMTEQPRKFNQDDDPITTSSSSITIKWNYTNIIPTDQTIRKFGQGETIKSRCLPFINEIKVQIKGNVTDTYSEQDDKWIDYTTLTIPNNQDYNTTDLFKTITFTKTNPSNADGSAVLNILSKTNPFYVRIYGINNNDNDFPPIDSRALEINGTNGVFFKEAAPPSQPLFRGDQSKSSEGNKYYLTSNFKVAETELDVPESSAVVDDYLTTFTENTEGPNDSLRSKYITLDAHSGKTSGLLGNIKKDKDFTIKVGNNNLRAGTKYDYTITVTNNISSANSDPSESQTSPYTRLPTSSGIGTTLTLTANTSKTYVTTSTINNIRVIYLNPNTNKTQFIPSNTSTQTIEITKPHKPKQEDTKIGFGRFVDNKNGLATIGIKINNTTKESIVFNGFKTTSGSEDDGTITQSGKTYFHDATIQDMYSDDDNNKGFRLKGTVQLRNIKININALRNITYTYEHTGNPATKVQYIMLHR